MGNVSQDNLVGLIPGRSVKTISNEFGLYSAGWRDTEFLKRRDVARVELLKKCSRQQERR